MGTPPPSTGPEHGLRLVDELKPFPLTPMPVLVDEQPVAPSIIGPDPIDDEDDVSLSGLLLCGCCGSSCVEDRSGAGRVYRCALRCEQPAIIDAAVAEATVCRAYWDVNGQLDDDGAPTGENGIARLHELHRLWLDLDRNQRTQLLETTFPRIVFQHQPQGPALLASFPESDYTMSLSTPAGELAGDGPGRHLTSYLVVI